MSLLLVWEKCPTPHSADVSAGVVVATTSSKTFPGRSSVGPRRCRDLGSPDVCVCVCDPTWWRGSVSGTPRFLLCDPNDLLSGWGPVLREGPCSVTSIQIPREVPNRSGSHRLSSPTSRVVRGRCGAPPYGVGTSSSRPPWSQSVGCPDLRFGSSLRPIH